MVPSSTSAVAPVWTMRKGAAVITRWAPKDVFLNIYAEEFHAEDHSLVGDDVEEPAVLLNASLHTASVSSRHDSVMVQDLPVFVAEPAQDVQQVCHTYAAQATTLLFDVAMPDDSVEELAFYNDIHPEVPTAPFRPAQQVEEYSPSSELLDTNDLKFQPTLVTGPLCDPVSQMLYFETYYEVQETISAPAPKRQGRSLLCLVPLYTVADLDELEADELYDIDQPGNTSKHQLTIFPGDDSSRDWEVEHDRVLRQVTSITFLPGFEYLNSVKVRSTFITYDSDIAALQKATAEFIADRHDGECFCLDDKVGAVVLPGENVWLADNDTGFGLFVQCPTADSLLNPINNLVDSEVFVEDRIGRQDPPLFAHSCVVHPLRPSALFDAVSSQYIEYTALDQGLDHSRGMSDIVCAQSVASDNVSDIHGEVIEALSTPRLSELTYVDTDRQQLVGYTAFNQLLIDMGDDELPNRIHREDYGLDDDEVFIDVVLEINEVRRVYQLSDLQPSLPSQRGNSPFDLDFHGASHSVMTNTTLPRSINSLRSYSSRRHSKRRPQLTITTQLSNIAEGSSDEDHTQPSTSSASSSDASIDFAEHRGFVQALSARRADFLDDENSDDVMATPQSVSAFRSPTVERFIVIDHLDNPIWHHEVNLYLAMPLTPVDPCSPSADIFPDVDILESLETELYELMATLFTCLNTGQFAEAQELGVDLQ